MSDSDNDDIPTLGEIIFPGNPDKVPQTAPAEPADVTPPSAAPSATAATKGESESESAGRPRPSSFESLISTRIDHILEKHMESAREEIVRMVMLELRARLPGTSRPNSNQD